MGLSDFRRISDALLKYLSASEPVRMRCDNPERNVSEIIQSRR